MTGTKKSGRKPKPKQQKELTGSKHYNPDTLEFDPLLTAVEPPAHMTGLAVDMWNTVCPQLCKQGVLAVTDLHNLEIFCRTYKRWREAEDIIEQDGIVVFSPTGAHMKKPACTAANEALSQLDKFGGNLGLAPASRSRLIGPKGSKVRNSFDEF